MAGPKHPRDAFITVYGRRPVLEALSQHDLDVDKLLIARGSRGEMIAAIERGAETRGIQPMYVDAREVTRLSRNRKQDQGVVVDVLAPRMQALDAYLELVPTHATLVVFDGLTTPANIGMAIRSMAAAGLDGVVLPRAGCPEIGSLVIKASAGVVFLATILRTPTVGAGLDGLRSAGFSLIGLDAASGAEDLFQWSPPPRVALVVGGETRGLSPETRSRLNGRVRIPLARGVESLNAAVAVSVAAFELARKASARRR